jgi:hypothetical protein
MKSNWRMIIAPRCNQLTTGLSLFSVMNATVWVILRLSSQARLGLGLQEFFKGS